MKKVIVTLLLTAFLCGILASCGEKPSKPPAPPTDPVTNPNEEVPGTEWDVKELLATDFLLYNVDCGSQTPGTATETWGRLQSAADQPYGPDSAGGYSWGYTPSDYLVAEADEDGKGHSANKWLVDDEHFDGEIAYRFGLPNGSYEVTVGFYNPVSVRKLEVECEGALMAENAKALRFQLSEAVGTVEVSDGELNLRVYNDGALSHLDSPMVSYIRVAVKPEYNAELLTAALERYDCQSVDAFTADTRGAYEAALDEANGVLSSGGDYEKAFLALRDAYQGLVEKYRYHSFTPGSVWNDTENNLIQAHGGQVQQLEIPDSVTGELTTKWVWVGEDKSLGYRGGIRAYSSDDLYNWQFEGVIMRNVDTREQLDEEEYFQTLYAGYTGEELDNVYRCINSTTSVIERPKLLYNEKTKQYVLWFHADGPTETSDANYAAASAGLAVSDSPFGPYRFVDRYRLNTCPEDQEDMYPQSKGMARDMNLFKDADGTAYIIYSSEENLTLYISRLNDEYTYLDVPPEEAVHGRDFIRIFPGWQREAPALFLRDGKYYLMTSGCTGWAPNQARYFTADSIFGEWTDMGDPCIGDTDRTTFHSQSTCIFQDPESGTWVYMGDRWNESDLTNSRYIWLPLNFDEEGNMSLSYAGEWTLDGQ